MAVAPELWEYRVAGAAASFLAVVLKNGLDALGFGASEVEVDVEAVDPARPNSFSNAANSVLPTSLSSEAIIRKPSAAFSATGLPAWKASSAICLPPSGRLLKAVLR